MQRKTPRPHLSGFVDALQARGRYTFDRPEALKELGVTTEALEAAVRRLAAKGGSPFRAEVSTSSSHPSTGAPAPLRPTGSSRTSCASRRGRTTSACSSAAALHGAAHQQPQEFQVVDRWPAPPGPGRRARIRFFIKATVESTPVVDVKTQTGIDAQSPPRRRPPSTSSGYTSRSVSLDHVATVLAELAEKLDAQALSSRRPQERRDLPTSSGSAGCSIGSASPQLAEALSVWVARAAPATGSCSVRVARRRSARGPAVARGRQRAGGGRPMIPRAHITAWRAHAPLGVGRAGRAGPRHQPGARRALPAPSSGASASPSAAARRSHKLHLRPAGALLRGHRPRAGDARAHRRRS